MTTVEDINRMLRSCHFCKQYEPADEIHHDTVTLIEFHAICLARAIVQREPIAEDITARLRQ